MIQSLPLPSGALRAAVTQHLPWAEAALWQPLFGGRTNSAWQIVSDFGQSAILKLYRAPALNPLFPNDADAEARLLQHLNGTGIAPKLIARFDCDQGRCNLYFTIPGEPWKSGVSDVAKLIKRLHSLPPVPGLRMVANGSDAILEQADAILARCANSARIKDLRPRLDVPPTQDTHLLHCDIVPGNLISNAEGLHLIDWQCPGQGDACEDIASFLSPAMQTLYRGSVLSRDETEEFLAAYGTLDAERFRQLAPAYHYRMAAYCQWQCEHEQPDYIDGLNAELEALF